VSAAERAIVPAAKLSTVPAATPAIAAKEAAAEPVMAAEAAEPAMAAEAAAERVMATERVREATGPAK
jgi:hypothetical protein